MQDFVSFDLRLMFLFLFLFLFFFFFRHVKMRKRNTFRAGMGVSLCGREWACLCEGRNGQTFVKGGMGRPLCGREWADLCVGGNGRVFVWAGMGVSFFYNLNKTSFKQI